MSSPSFRRTCRLLRQNQPFSDEVNPSLRLNQPFLSIVHHQMNPKTFFSSPFSKTCIGYILNPDFSFVKIAAPYAQELLDIRQRQPTGPQLVQQITKQAKDVRTNSISMPLRVQRIEKFVKQVEAGDLKL
ncbi:Protein kinase superfamily protein [Trifolium repens]|nr:Protein kinase superfamily protein [Trifolium repens]